MGGCASSSSSRGRGALPSPPRPSPSVSSSLSVFVLEGAEKVDQIASNWIPTKRWEAQEPPPTSRLLLLGTGDAGKTVLFKQFRRLYGEGGLSAQECRTVVPDILRNLMEGACTVAIAIRDVGGVHDDGELDEAIAVLGNDDRLGILDETIAGHLRYVFGHAKFNDLLQRSELNVRDCFPMLKASFETKFPGWGGTSGWVPTLPEAVSGGLPTKGGKFKEFKIQVDDVPYLVADVGGQRSEVTNWRIAFGFAPVTGILYVVSLSDYDQTLVEPECGSVNRLVEALDRFEATVNAAWFADTRVLLLFNKSDQFHFKFVKKRIALNASGCFPTAPVLRLAANGVDNSGKAVEWIRDEFIKRAHNKEQIVDSRVLSAVECDSIRNVFEQARQNPNKASGFRAVCGEYI